MSADADAYAVAYAKAARGEPLTRADMLALSGYKHSAYAQHRHEWEAFRLHPPIGQLEYSGVLVYRHLRSEATRDAQPDPTPGFIFGRKTFGKRRA